MPVAESIYVAKKNPALKARRKQIGAGTKTWDLAWNIALWPLMASIAAAGGLQHGANGSSLPADDAAAGIRRRERLSRWLPSACRFSKWGRTWLPA